MIFALLFLTLLQFFVSYTHSLILESQGHELSERACKICGFTGQPVAGNEFRRLQQLIALCPRLAADGHKIRAVALYFGLLCLTRILLQWLMPSATVWIEKERAGCAYFAAVDLDRRIFCSRMKMTGQES
jgi:hypothetical protein